MHPVKNCRIEYLGGVVEGFGNLPQHTGIVRLKVLLSFAIWGSPS